MKRLRQGHACFNSCRKPPFAARDLRHKEEGYTKRFHPGVYDFDRRAWRYASTRYPLLLQNPKTAGNDLKLLRSVIDQLNCPIELEKGEMMIFEDGMGVDRLFLAWHAQGHTDVMVSG